MNLFLQKRKQEQCCNSITKYGFLVMVIFLFMAPIKNAIAQEKVENDTTKKVSTFEKFNNAAMKVFKYVPYPMVTYANETGTVFGLVKYDLVRLVKSDTVSTASSFSEMLSVSSKGQFKVVLGTQQFYLQNRVIFKSEIQYVDFPDYILGVGNDVDRNMWKKWLPNVLCLIMHYCSR